MKRVGYFFFGLSNSVRCLCVLFRNGIFSTDVLQFLAVRNDRAVTSLVFYEGRRSHFSKTCEDQEAFLFLFILKKKALSGARFSLALLHNFFSIFQVPRVFIGGTFVGGGDDVQMLQNKGQLKPKLENAGAL